MAAASPWISALSDSLRQNQPMTFHPTSALLNPQITRPCFCPINPNIFKFSFATATTSSARRWPKEARTVRSATDNRVVEGNDEYNEDVSSWLEAARVVRSGNTTRVVKGSSEYSDDEGSREIAKFLRPQEVPWQKELANTVHFIGIIGSPVQFKHTQSGKAFAWTRLAVRSGSNGETMWFPLTFWNELAETAAQHLKKNDRVYVSGFLALQTTAGENDQPKTYKVIAKTLNFVERTSPEFSQQVVVNKNNPSLALYEQSVIHKDTPLQYQKSPVKSSSSGKNTQEDAATIESLWQAFFASPLEWWDNRNNKRNPRAPDFKHKDTGEALWIGSRYNPLWVKSQLDVLDSRMKDLGEWGGGRSSTRSRGSLSSFQDSDF